MDGPSDEGAPFAIFNHLSDAVVVTDAGFRPPGPRIIYVNDAFVSLCGHRPSELLNQPLALVHPDLESPEKLAAVEACCRRKLTYTNRGTLSTVDGATTSLSWHMAPVFRGSRMEHLVCMVSEVSDTPEFVQALRVSEKRYRNLFEHGLIGKAVLDRDGRFLKVNESFCDMLGFEKDELIGVHSSIVIMHEERESVFDWVNRVFSGEIKGYQSERRYVHKDGRVVTALVDVVPELDEQGIVQSVVVQAQDISELKATEAALRESDNQLNAIFDHSPAEVYLKDAEGRYVKVNKQFEKLFNVRNEDVRGKLPHEVQNPDLAGRTRAHDLEVLKTGRDLAREEHIYLSGSADEFPHILHILKFPIRDKDRVIGLGAIATDITEIKQAEQLMRESEGRLRDFAEIAADWFWETDENLVITYVSDVHRQITGIPDARIIGRTREELFRDNIYKAINPAVHLRTLRNYWDSMVEYSVVREDGREIVVHDRASPFFDNQGNFKGYRGVGRDITEQRQLTERIAYQATRDSLTGTVNRREFERRLDEAVADAHGRGAEHVLCFVDLDKFKLLNDTLGHAAGDFLLKTIVEQIQEKIPADGLLGRIGGDEFGILLRNTDSMQAKRLALMITRSIKAHQFEWENRRFNVAMSIGLAPINKGIKSSSELLARADSACYRAKEAGRDGVWVSEESEAARLRTYTDILRSLASGPPDLSDNFQLVGQPICGLAEGDSALAWYEVLLRLVGDDGRFYRPYEFIRLAEQHGRMPLIDHWVLETAAASHAALVRQIPDAVMSLNLSGMSLNDEQRQDELDELVAEYGLQPANLCFEIGERTAMSDMNRTAALVASLSNRGYRVALDEFGSGPFSFACLKHVPVQYLKIYGELVRGFQQNETDIAIIESINALSVRLGLTTIAVQVETRPAAETLKRIGVPYGQGEGLSTTRPLAELNTELPCRFT